MVVDGEREKEEEEKLWNFELVTEQEGKKSFQFVFQPRPSSGSICWHYVLSAALAWLDLLSQEGV